jgi:hypothetical protein
VTAHIFREINNRPILWRDGIGTIHACEGFFYRGDLILQTLCARPVPTEEAGIDLKRSVDCAICKSRKGIG